MAFIAIFIFLVAGPLSALTTGEEFIKPVPYLQPIVREPTVHLIAEVYDSVLSNLLNYKLRAANSLESILNEIAFIQPAFVSSPVKGADPNTLQKYIISHLSLNRGTPKDTSAEWRKFCQQVYQAGIVAAEMKKFDAAALMTPELITAAFGEYLRERPNEFKSPADQEKYLKDLILARTQTFATMDEKYTNFLDFHADPYKHVDEMLTKMVVYWVQVIGKSHPDFPGFKIAEMSEFLLPKYGYSRVEYLVSSVITNLRKVKPWDPSMHVAVLEILFRQFLMTTNPSELALGKRLFLSYFSPRLGTEKAPVEYLRFLRLKYRRERLKFAVENVVDGYPELLRLYTLDVLDASLQTAEEFVRPDDLRFIFQNFRYFSTTPDANLIPYMLGVRRLFTANLPYLGDFYELFNGLYDAVLLSGPYLVGKFFPPEWTSKGLVFSGFLDSLLSWQNSKVLSWWEWQPDPKHFAVNIQTNYPFYKLVTLMAFKEDFESAGIWFAKFQKRDDQLIHQFTLQREYRHLLFCLKSGRWKGFQYNSLSGQSYSADDTKACLQREKEHLKTLNADQLR